MFEAVPHGERRYADGKSTDPAFEQIEQGTSLEAQSGPFSNRFDSFVLVKKDGADDAFTAPKSKFLAQPLDRRKRYSAEEKAAIKVAGHARNRDIFEISRRICEERAATIVRAVLLALRTADVDLPANLFRKGDSFEEIVAIIKAADLRCNLCISHSNGGKSGPAHYVKNIKDAVTRLTGLQEELKVQEPQEVQEVHAVQA